MEILAAAVEYVHARWRIVSWCPHCEDWTNHVIRRVTRRLGKPETGEASCYRCARVNQIKTPIEQLEHRPIRLDRFSYS